MALPSDEITGLDRAAITRLVTIGFIVGLALRLLFLGSKSLWLDEARSLVVAEGGLTLLWEGQYEAYHPPLYYLLLRYWLALGRSEFMLRLSSALLGSAAIPLAYWLARSLAPAGAGLSAAWLVALSPLLVWYSQELRSYSLLVALGLATARAVVGLVARPHWSRWLLFTGAMTAALYTHYNALLLIPVHLFLMGILYLQKRATQRGVIAWLAAWPVIFLLYWPWLRSPAAATFLRLLQGRHLYPVQLLAERLGITLTAAVLGAAFFGLILLAALVPILWRRWGATSRQGLAARPLVRQGLLLLFLLSVVASVAPRAYALKRLLVLLWPYGLLLLAWVFPWRRHNRLALALLLGASLAGSIANIALIPKDQWRETVAHILAQQQPGDTVWIQPFYHDAPFNYYSQGAIPLVHVDGHMSDEQLQTLLGEHQRVWHVYQTRDLHLVDPAHRVEQWLVQHLDRVEHIRRYQVVVDLYERHKRPE